MKKNLLLFSALLFLFFIGCNDQPTLVENNQSSQDVTALSKTSYTFADDYIVEYTDEAKFLEAVSTIGGKIQYNHSAIKYASVTNIDSKSAKKLTKMNGIKNVTQDIIVQWVDPDEQVEEASIGSDEAFWPYQWAPRAIHAPEAWDAGYTGAGVRVAVIDGGISSNHIDIKDNIDFTKSASFVPGKAFDEDGPGFRHATHVAGIIAAEDNGKGTIGIAPNATIIALKALDHGSGSFGAVIAAIYYAANDADADIINMSLGAVFPRNSLDAAKLIQAMGAAVNFAYQKGVTVVVAAGNDGIDFDHAGMWVSEPAEIQHVICVSATGPTDFANGGTNFDNPSSYTNYGQSLVSFAAPGGNDLLYPNGLWAYDLVLSPSYVVGTTYYYSFAEGTSMAAPHVAGVAALIIGKNGGSMNPAQVEAALRASADDLGKPGNDDFYGAGRVNAAKAVGL